MLTNHIRACLFFAAVAIATANLNYAAAVAEEPTSEPLTIFAAASLSDVLPALVGEWQKTSGKPKPRISFAASAVLARQIEAGAPADLFFSANEKWVRHIADRKFTEAVIAPLAHNKLVFAAPCRLTDINPQSIEELGSLLMSGRFAMADPATAPAGEYAQQFLDRHNLWPEVQTNATYAGNARLTLLLIERGGLPGFVYASDATKSNLVCTVHDLSSFGAEAVTYFGLKTSTQTDNTASLFLYWLGSSSAQKIWRNHGFEQNVSN